MDLLVTTVVGAVAILVATLYTIRSVLAPATQVKGTTNIPGPNDGGHAWPFLGDAWRFAGVQNMKEMMEVFERLLTHCSKAVSVWIGPRLIIFVTDPEIAHVILTSPKSRDKDPTTYMEFNKFVDGVFSRNGKRWSDLRRPLNKFIQPHRIVESFSEVFVTKSEELCELLEKRCGQGVFDALDPFFFWSCDVALANLLGLPANCLKEKPRFDFQLLVTSVVELALKANFQVHNKVEWISYLTGFRKEVNRTKQQVAEVAKWFVEERLKILAASAIDPEDPGFTPESYIDIVIQNNMRENVSGDRALTGILDFVVAAVDTTAVALSSACLFLAMHPEYQEKAYKEQIAIMGDSLRAPTQEEMDKMNYLRMVYMETLRHVGVPGVVRIINSPIDVDGLTFPEGASAYIALHSLHMDPKYWVKTKAFYPDNFLPEFVERRPKGVFEPFSAGVRNCPGEKFSVTSGYIVLSMLLRRFSFTTPMKFDEIEYKYMLMVESVKGYPIEITMRNRVT